MIVHDGGLSTDIPQMPSAPEKVLFGRPSVNRSAHLTTYPGLEGPPNLGTQTARLPMCPCQPSAHGPPPAPAEGRALAPTVSGESALLRYLVHGAGGGLHGAVELVLGRVQRRGQLEGVADGAGAHAALVAHVTHHGCNHAIRGWGLPVPVGKKGDLTPSALRRHLIRSLVYRRQELIHAAVA